MLGCGHGDEGSGQGDLDLSLDQLEFPLLPTSSPLEQQQLETSWSQDGDLQELGQLEKRWVLWHVFMKEHAHLDGWLRLAEQAVSSPDPAHITYVTAKEEVRKLERLRRDSVSQLIQLDSLTLKNRLLTRMFHGAMRSRLLELARECGRRWDDVNAKLEVITGKLKRFVSEWEEFEAEREELALWLADLDGRLTAVDHLTGNTCEKLRQLQSFQQCVCVNSARVNVLLQRGEALIQSSQPMDAQRVERNLQELLRHCSLVYNNIARTHTRLLSMRLVFEDDCILPQATDSGCPSESLLEDEGALDKLHQDVPASPNRPKDLSKSGYATLSPPVHLPSPTHDPLGLEWDPSVDIGRSVSRDDADSSYLSVSTGHRRGARRRSYLSSLSSQPDVSDGIGPAHPSAFSPVATQEGGAWLNVDQWVTSTPESKDAEPISFDGGRVRAWLDVQSSTPVERTTSCSRAVQTDRQCHHIDASNQLRPKNTQPSQSHDLKALIDWTKHQHRSNRQAAEDSSCCEETESRLLEQRPPPSSWFSPALLCLLLAAALTLTSLILFVLEPPCRCCSISWRPHGFHLALRYVNGPPPT